ncbi:hypothetical protein GCM10023340_29850 [Nocardioides marinquilinus]|uniref:Barstar (barnase inhibitor) domain-containing protein n=1 Tax=Nocardioides marinquilinus TaxID=1210400 RepID=A0ABP9PTN5_9ACTN
MSRLRQRVEDAGWRLARVGPVTGPAALHDVLARELGLPDWYGRNLDALADCLHGLEGHWVLLWTDWPALAHHHPRLARVARDLLEARVVVVDVDGAGGRSHRITGDS